jgi:hypothetical protein
MHRPNRVSVYLILLRVNYSGMRSMSLSINPSNYSSRDARTTTH